MSHAVKYRAAPSAPQQAASARRGAPGHKASRRGKSAGRAAARLEAMESGEQLWKKILAWCTLICAPGAALLLLAFVWQINGALEPAGPADSAPVSRNSSPARPGRAIYAANSSSSDKTAKNRLTFLQQPRQAGPNSGPDHKNRAYGSNMRFLHTGLVYSSFLVLIATLCIALLLARLMARDKHRRRAWQSLQVMADTTIENRVRHRTAHLTKACHLAEKERQRVEVLLQDTSHRVGNSLATVSSLLGLQLRQCPDKQVQKALLSARDRIQAISAAHRRLRLGEDMETASAGEFLSAVVHDIENGLTAAQRRHITISSRFEPCFLPARDVTTLGIILGELVTNAVKHAFPDNKQGKISVSFGRGTGKTLRLIVEDNGIGLPPAANPGAISGQAAAQQGLGRLIVSQLAAQFNTRPHYSGAAKGGSRVIIPLLNSSTGHNKTAVKKAAA